MNTSQLAAANNPQAIQTTSKKALALCHAIEAAGASKELTKCSVLATELHAEIKKIAERDAFIAKSLTEHIKACFPEDENGQKHFARVLCESWADELINGTEGGIVA